MELLDDFSVYSKPASTSEVSCLSSDHLRFLLLVTKCTCAYLLPKKKSRKGGRFFKIMQKKKRSCFSYINICNCLTDRRLPEKSHQLAISTSAWMYSVRSPVSSDTRTFYVILSRISSSVHYYNQILRPLCLIDELISRFIINWISAFTKKFSSLMYF